MAETVCDPLAADSVQLGPGRAGAVAGPEPLLLAPGGCFCSPGPGACSPFCQAVGPPGGGRWAGHGRGRLRPSDCRVPPTGPGSSRSCGPFLGRPGGSWGLLLLSWAWGLSPFRTGRRPSGWWELQHRQGRELGGVKAQTIAVFLGSPGPSCGSPSWPFYPSPEFSGLVCASRPEPVKSRDPSGVRGGGDCPSLGPGCVLPRRSRPGMAAVLHRKRRSRGRFFAEYPGVSVSVSGAQAQRRHARGRKSPECPGPHRVTAERNFRFFPDGGSRVVYRPATVFPQTISEETTNRAA